MSDTLTPYGEALRLLQQARPYITGGSAFGGIDRKAFRKRIDAFLARADKDSEEREDMSGPRQDWERSVYEQADKDNAAGEIERVADLLRRSTKLPPDDTTGDPAPLDAAPAEAPTPETDDELEHTERLGLDALGKVVYRAQHLVDKCRCLERQRDAALSRERQLEQRAFNDACAKDRAIVLYRERAEQADERERLANIRADALRSLASIHFSAAQIDAAMASTAKDEIPKR